MKNKKVIIFVILILIIIFVSFFICFNYKKIKSGNTMINKSEEDIKDYILNISSYSACMDIEVITNKNKTKYKIKQEQANGKSYQEVIEPENIAGVTTIYENNELKISNNKLDLTTTFQNYEFIVNNSLWLDSFIKDYSNAQNVKLDSNENEIVIELKNEENNKYTVYKTLYIDKKTSKPTKMIIKDINKNTTIYILYTKIEIS